MKKGVVFTVITVVFLMMMLYSASYQHSYSLRQRSQIVGDRVKTIDFFIDDLKTDINRGVYIAMFRGLLGVQQYITSEGKFLNDTERQFREIMVNGTINGNYISVMNQTEFSVWIQKIRSEANKIGVDFDYTINDVRLYHQNPWVVTLDLNLTLKIRDMKNTCNWTRTELISTDLNITSFEDPLYSVYTYGRIANTIQKTPYTNFVNGTNTTALLEHVDGGYYIESTSGPDYVMRLGGLLTNSSFGIESIVNLKSFEDVLLTIQDKSCIDYTYFSNNTPISYDINETYNWLQLDNDSGHLVTYQVQHLI